MIPLVKAEQKSFCNFTRSTLKKLFINPSMTYMEMSISNFSSNGNSQANHNR